VHFFTLRAAFFAFDISLNMYADHTPLQAAGQLLLAFAFLATSVRNAGWKFRSHAERMAAYGVPHPELALVAGFALQFAGAVLLLLDVHLLVAAI
jgi:uncharacterized membrane protein YphA (DoxX/SURF4 family)